MYEFLVENADEICIDKELFGDFTFGAWHGNKLISLMSIENVEESLKPTFSRMLNSNKVDKYGYATNLMTRKDYQKSGIATKFALMVIQHYIKYYAGSKKGIIAEVETNEPKLANVYKRYGLRKIGEREYTIARKSYSNIVLAAKFADLMKSLPSTSGN